MAAAQLAWLADRGVVSVTGMDAAKLLQGLITSDMELLDAEPAMLAGLLSPQGKVLFDFLVVRTDGGYLLETAREQAAGLSKRLSMYRLRADVRIEDVSEDHVVGAIWGEGRELPAGLAIAHYRDPRDRDIGTRLIATSGNNRSVEWAGIPVVPLARYHAHRIALGVPEGGKDYDLGDAFPHEANFDIIGGVSFEKGCYVGQEIVARMEHRATVRKRVVRMSGAAVLPADRPDIVVGEVVIGRLGSVAGIHGLGLVRLDRAIEAIDKGQVITAGGIALEIDVAAIERQRAALARKAQMK
jgi:tRNA-modifying protein YgfZ